MSAIPEAITQASTESAVKAITAMAEKQPDTQDMKADGYALEAYSALQIAAQILTDPSETQKTAAELLYSTRFETAGGTVSFTHAGLRQENPYRLMRFNGKDFEPVQ